MTSYGVTLTYEERLYVEVEASSIEEAEEKALIAVEGGEAQLENEYDEPDYSIEVEKLS